MIINNPNTQGGHWLTVDDNDEPTYVPNCDLRVARKVGASPSVTGVDGILEKTGLNIWKQNGIARIAIHTDRMQGENDDELIRRIISDHGTLNKEAMTYGTYIHAQAEAILNEQPYDGDEPFVAKLAEWIGDNVTAVHWAEKTLLHPTRLYGGRADALVELKGQDGRFLLDWKSQKFGYRNGKCSPHWYDSYVRQLAAYADCVGVNNIRPRIASVAVNTVAPTAPVIKIWTEAQQANALRQFMLVAELWCLLKNYDPRMATRAAKPKPKAKEAIAA